MTKPKDNRLNIGRDDTTTPALFVHAPRAPEVSKDYPNQRRFGGRTALCKQLDKHDEGAVRITVYRNAEIDGGELMVAVMSNWNEMIRATVAMSADDMQMLACALLDAAHDIRTRPVIKADVQAVPA